MYPQTLQGLKLISPAAEGCLGVLSYFHEYPTMVQRDAFAIVSANWPTFLVAASLGLVVNLLSLVIIKLSSATTLKVRAISAHCG